MHFWMSGGEVQARQAQVGRFELRSRDRLNGVQQWKSSCLKRWKTLVAWATE